MTRTFYDSNLRQWEAYVTGGQPGSVHAARIFFVCQADPDAHPRYVRHASGNAAEAQTALLEYSDKELVGLLEESLPLELSA